MKLTPSSSVRKRTQTSKGTEMLYTLTSYEFEKLKRVMRDLYDSDQTEHGNAIFEIMSKLGRISTGKIK